MRVVESNVNRLVLRGERAAALPVIGAVLLLLGLGAIFSLVRSAELHCERDATREGTTCVVTERVLGLWPLEQRRIGGVLGAGVEERRDEDGTKYHGVLFTRTEAVRVTAMDVDWHENLDRALEPVDRLARGEVATAVDVALPVAWEAVTFAAFFCCFAVWILLLSRPAQAELDRRSGTLTMRRRSVLGTGFQQWPLAEIAEVFVDTAPDSDGATYAVVVRRKDNRKELLDRGYTDRREPKDAAVERIRAFLGHDRVGHRAP